MNLLILAVMAVGVEPPRLPPTMLMQLPVVKHIFSTPTNRVVSVNGTIHLLPPLPPVPRRKLPPLQTRGGAIDLTKKPKAKVEPKLEWQYISPK